ncbi:argininosuccinate lyase (plasmid) [Microvirga lotononidis]|uniref:Argininosuccinate lyase n=2 Tax=Microvirga lotononidis TaxID=864069 RepID=I4YR07_9HYPH|nr:argininosuccinate lyase [Microvirga lotononidis]EIM26399.1 argininosuccinate lyase [Microvirga lotononidis]WQO30762.1 argininosuccinate lyase [Microvirga lotononidis]
MQSDHHMQNFHVSAGDRPEARLDSLPAKELLSFFEAPHLEREKRQFQYFIRVDLAHTVMLGEREILTGAQTRSILETLKEIETVGPEGIPMDPTHGSLLFQIERYLISRVGEHTGGRMHIGRSRLDQGPTARRLYKRSELLLVMDGIGKLRANLLDLAGKHHETIMPGYTCLQHAHPGVFGQYLLGFCNKLGDDFDRLAASYGRLNLNPLGGAGLSGTSWPIDRSRTTELLGFDGLVKNSRLAREAYYAAEVASSLSFLMSTLNDLATDLHLWSSYEFGFIETADELCGTSSIFPQKKNPTALEAVKFAAGEAVTWLSTALATFRAEGTGDVVMRELPLLDRAFVAASGSLALMSAVIQTLRVDEARMKRLAAANWSTATDLADEIVRRRDISFREAHNIVARLVRIATMTNLQPADLTGSLLDEAADELKLRPPRLDDETVFRAFDVDTFVRSRVSTGSVHPGQVSALQEDEANSLLAGNAWLDDRRKKLAEAEHELKRSVNRFIAAA